MNWYQKWRSLTSYSYQYRFQYSFICLLRFLFELSELHKCTVASSLQWWLLNTFYQLIALVVLQQWCPDERNRENLSLNFVWVKCKPFFYAVNGLVCNLCKIIEMNPKEKKKKIIFFVAITCIRVKTNEWTKYYGMHWPHSRQRLLSYRVPRNFMFWTDFFCFESVKRNERK